jgi:predicted nucleotidyltransferase
MEKQSADSLQNPPSLALIEKTLPDQGNINVATSELSLAQIYQRLDVAPEKIVTFCEKWDLVELALFGSVLRADFQCDGENPSDIDVLFTYSKNAHKNLLLQVQMQYELEDLLHREVDLVSKTALLNDHNYIRRQDIISSAMVIYAAR